jgi:hypothetical protein
VPVKVVSQRIGHADIAVTLKVYAHVMPGDDEDAALRADLLLARATPEALDPDRNGDRQAGAWPLARRAESSDSFSAATDPGSRA